MQIGYVTFNTEERQRVMKVLQMVRDQTAIDELGLGRIRDAFANEMFPGMSTLQRRAKYFAVLPSLYYEAAKLRYRSREEVHHQIIHWEIRLTDMLCNGANTQEDRNGITGSSMLEAAKNDETKFVRYDPTYIYQTGLRTYNMIRGNGNLEQLIFERSRKLSELPTRLTDIENGADADEQTGMDQLFATCGEHYDFDRGEMLQVNLTEREAQFIKRHIELSPNSKDSLLAYLLHENTSVAPNYAALSPLWQDLPTHFQKQYRLALHFSNWAYYMHLRYRYLFFLGKEDTEQTAHYDGLMHDWLEQHPEILDSSRMEAVLEHVWTRTNEPTVHQFCRNAAKLLAKNEMPQLDSLIRHREKQIKQGRNKINNPKYRAYDMSEPRVMTFRWDEIVYQLITEIRNAICPNEEIH